MCILRLEHILIQTSHISALNSYTWVVAIALGWTTLDSLQVSLVPYLFPLFLGLPVSLLILYTQSLYQDPQSFP